MPCGLDSQVAVWLSKVPLYVSQVALYGAQVPLYRQSVIVDEGYEINFEYLYLNPDKAASDPDVRYTKKRADESVSYVYNV